MATLYLRDVDEAIVREMKRAARARDLTLPQYLERLVELHQRAMVSRQEGGVGALLRDCGLQEVRA